MKNINSEFKYETYQEMINQIKICGFTDEIGHPLENNIGFIELQDFIKRILMGLEMAKEYITEDSELGETTIVEMINNLLKEGG